jgi:hypothetical protein
MAGKGGRGTRGRLKGKNGDIWMAPETIFLRDAKIEGGNLSIVSNALLDMSSINGRVISATEKITLAVGTEGVIDFSDNQEIILHADEEIVIFSDEIRLDNGLTLTDVVSAPRVLTGTPRLLRDLSVSAPQVLIARPSITQPINLTILNNSPYTETYDLTLTDSVGWSLSEHPTSVTVEELGDAQFTLNFTVPDNASHGQKNTMTFTVTSQNDKNINKITYIEVVVSHPIIYLPLIRK